MAIITIKGNPPKGTEQEKGECIMWKYDPKTKQKKPFIHHYKKNTVSKNEQWYAAGLLPYVPEKPISGLPIHLTVTFVYSLKSAKKGMWKPKITKPDTDNLVKGVKDVMTKLGFWEDDALVYDEHLMKYATGDDEGCVIIEYGVWSDV